VVIDTNSDKRDEELDFLRRKMLINIMKKKMYSRSKVTLPKGVIHLNTNNFNQTISKHPIVVVDFWAEWCAPCRAYAPIYEDLAKKYGDKAVFAKINVDENPFIAQKYNVMSIPTTIVYFKGREYRRFIGLSYASIQNLIRIINYLHSKMYPE